MRRYWAPAATRAPSWCGCWQRIRRFNPALTADRQAGKTLGEVFPHLGRLDRPVLTRIEDQDWAGIDVVFAALPHGTTQEVIAALPTHLKIIDLSADFRLADPATYAIWYGHEHRAVALQRQAVYGLTELARDEVRTAGWSPIPDATQRRRSCR